MTDKIVAHPYAELLAEAKRECEICKSPEAQALQDAIFEAVRAYSDFLDRNELIFDDGDEGITTSDHP